MNKIFWICLVLAAAFIYLSCRRNGEDGDNGYSSLTKVDKIQAGIECEKGGFRISTGIDSNRDKILTDDEVLNTQFFCYGEDLGHDSSEDNKYQIIDIQEEAPGDNCPYGGLKFNLGKDVDMNGMLNEDEIISSHFICNSNNSKELRFDFNMASNSSYGTTSSEIYNEFNSIQQFNIQNFHSVDSVIFSAFIKAENSSEQCQLELYDYTNSKPIKNSMITTSETSYTWINTQYNLKNEFPDSPIDLRIRMTSLNGNYVNFKTPRLILIWK
ncbi:MAG: hypothetical protein N4A49_13465 [Marinifilaceae bacterium]|jgi:hypothetical protein|nr:hypothetical protein [Marinifilaceae bacterium]